MADNILTALLVNSAIFSALFGLMLLLRKLMAKRISAVLQYALWAVVVIKLVIPFGFQSSLSPFGMLTSPGNNIAAIEQKGGGTVPAPNDNSDGLNTSDAARPETVSAENTSFNTANALTGQNEAEGASEAAQTLNLSVWALIIWGAGVLAAGTVRILCAASLKRRARHSEQPAPERVLRIIEGCKRELGLKRRVRVIAQSALRVPAVIGAFRPMLILPEDIETQTDDRVRHICFHELIHVKYGDPGVIALLGILRAAYWFNPLVWLCFIFIRRDMEAACDARVLKILGSGARREYIGTVLKFAGRKEEPGLRTAAGMADGRFTMEQRVRCMFRKARTGIKSRITAACIALLMLAACALTACQPAPGKAIVLSNNDAVQNSVESIVPDDSQAVIHKFSAPQSWQGETDDMDKNIDIKVDAKVDIPADTWGTYQLTTLTPDKAYLDAVLKTLIGDAQIYGEDTYRSKSELQEEITKLNGFITALQTNTDFSMSAGDPKPIFSLAPGAVPSDGEKATIDVNATIKYYQGLIAQAQQALENAPDKPETKRVSIDPGILFEDTADITSSGYNQEACEYGEQSINVYSEGSIVIKGLVDIGRDAPAEIYLNGTNDVRFQIGCGDNGGFGGREPLNGKTPEGVTVSQSEAEQTARQKVAAMGFNYLDIASADKMSVYNSTARKETECYAFTFTRSLDGVPATFAYGNGIVKGNHIVPTWNISEVVIGIDDSGVIYADINVPRSDVQQLSKGVELKSFNDIMDIFKQQAVIQGCYCEVGNTDELKYLTGRTVNIDDIKLGYMPTASKDNPDQVIFVPVWDFFGSEVMQFSGKVGGDLGESLDKNDQFHYDYGEQSFLTINAIDGTIMQRTGGQD